VGKLQNGKVFDRSDRFDFRIGVNEVIQGWDIGVAGMQVRPRLGVAGRR
jgi:FK506-binding nuclear protein